MLSALYDRYAVSLGQLHSDTNGFRPNNDLKQDIYDVFAPGRYRSLPWTSKANTVYRIASQGDRRLNFDPDGVPFDSFVGRRLPRNRAALGPIYAYHRIPRSSFQPSMETSKMTICSLRK